MVLQFAKVNRNLFISAPLPWFKSYLNQHLQSHLLPEGDLFSSFCSHVLSPLFCLSVLLPLAFGACCASFPFYCLAAGQRKCTATCVLLLPCTNPSAFGCWMNPYSRSVVSGSLLFTCTAHNISDNYLYSLWISVCWEIRKQKTRHVAVPYLCPHALAKVLSLQQKKKMAIQVWQEYKRKNLLRTHDLSHNLEISVL